MANRQATRDGIETLISHGHSYDRHVRGTANGVNEFTDSSYGRDLGIESKQDLKDYLDDFFDKEGTKAIKDGDNYIFYNKQDNVMVVFNPKDPDMGTVFRPTDGAQHWKSKVDSARAYAKANGQKLNIAEGPDEVGKVADRFAKDVNKNGNARQRYNDGMDKIDNGKKPPNGPDDPDPPPHNPTPPDGGGGKPPKTGSFWDDMKRVMTDFGRALGKVATKLTKILGPIGIIGVAIEGSALAATLEQSIDDNEITEDAREEYLAILGAHALQATGDPTLVGGEAVVQELYRAWAEKHGIDPDSELYEKLKPSHLTPEALLDKIHEARTSAFSESLSHKEIAPDMPEEVRHLVELNAELAALEDGQSMQNQEITSLEYDPLAPEPVYRSIADIEMDIENVYLELQEMERMDVVSDYIEKEEIFDALPSNMQEMPENPSWEVVTLAYAKVPAIEAERIYMQAKDTTSPGDAQALWNQWDDAKEQFNETYEQITETEEGYKALQDFMREQEVSAPDEASLRIDSTQEANFTTIIRPS